MIKAKIIVGLISIGLCIGSFYYFLSGQHLGAIYMLAAAWFTREIGRE